jgi:hypothetical protein
MQPDALAKIPLVDLRGHTSLELLFLFRRPAHILAEGALKFLGPVRPLAPLADGASRRWLENAHNPYLPEIRLIAEAMSVKGAYLLNTCLEWGCTSGAWATEQGPLLRRSLDWPFPRLGEFVVVAQFSGRLGSYYNVTWPGFVGALQGMAPGRFAAAINMAPMKKRGFLLPGDWLAGRIETGQNHALPPAHLLRRAFETARDYQAARQMLSMTPVAVPTIFTLTGTRSGEGCVIERTPDNAVVREMASGKVCATNQFQSRLADNGEVWYGGWRPRPIDSAGRYAKAITIAPEAEDFSWFTPPIANPNARLVLAANAATGTLKVMGTDGAEPVTEVFDLPE